MTTAARARLAAALARPEPAIAPLCLDALTARLLDELGYGCGYLSGGALGYAHGVSEALLTLTELADTARHITQRSRLPLIVDGGVGFGDAVHTTRAIAELEASGAAAVEIEDQVAPKRVSHHRGIEHLISSADMVAKIRYAVAARQDVGFLIIARTGAVANESFDRALARCNAYREAGADLVMLMPRSDEQRRDAPARLQAPLATIAMLDSPADWSGWALVIDPITFQVAALDAVRAAASRFMKEGTTGLDPTATMASYRGLPRLAGLDPLFEIEDATTERK